MWGRVYWDSSIVMSHLLGDAHTEQARELTLELNTSAIISELVRMEISNSTLRRVGFDGFQSNHAERLLRFFEEQIEQGWFRVVSAKPKVLNRIAMRLINHYSAELKVRTLDILHVAEALNCGANSLWTFDQRQHRLAEAVGLKVNRLD